MTTRVESLRARDISSAQPRQPKRRLPRDIPRFLLLCVEAVIFLAPIYWMIATSLKPEVDTTVLPTQWIPAHPTLENYTAVLTTPDGNILRWAWNSIFSSAAYTLIYVTICVLTAYPLARLNFRGRETWFWIILSSLMLPGIVILIPTYIMMIQFNWIDTFHALIWPGVGAVFGVFMLRQFFIGLPFELEESARMDGANSLQVLFYVILPLSVPALVTLAVFSFLGSWNSYIWPLFVVHGDMLTLPVGIGSFSSRYEVAYGKLMAGAAIASIPALVAYILAQRYIVSGITLTGMKE